MYKQFNKTQWKQGKNCLRRRFVYRERECWRATLCTTFARPSRSVVYSPLSVLLFDSILFFPPPPHNTHHMQHAHNFVHQNNGALLCGAPCSIIESIMLSDIRDINANMPRIASILSSVQFIKSVQVKIVYTPERIVYKRIPTRFISIYLFKWVKRESDLRDERIIWIIWRIPRNSP